MSLPAQLTVYAFVLVALCSSGCTGPRQAALQLQTDPVMLTIVQRRTKEVPGYDGELMVKIGDITGGQVLLEILDAEGKPILDTVSVSPSNVVSFAVEGQQYYLFVKELRNFLTSDDFGVFEISTTQPEPQVPAPKSDPEQKSPATTDIQSEP